MYKKLNFLKSFSFKHDFFINEVNTSQNIAQNTLMRSEVIKVFKSNDNKPLTRGEIWNLIESKLTITEARLNDMLGRESDDSSWVSQKKSKLLFKLVSTTPKKYILNSSYFEEEVEDNSEINLKDKMNFIEASQLILKQNDNTPMSANEIWDEIEEQDLVETSGATPWATLNASMLAYADNSRSRTQRKTKLFHVVSDNPAMFILINPENEVQPVEGTEKLDDGNDIIKFGSYISSTGGSPNYTSTPSRPVKTVDKYDFTLSSDIENKPSEVKESPTGHIINPFRQAVCILGESGAGKSTTIYNILKEEKHDSQFIIPSASTTGLLSQFSPRENGYIQSRLGKMIEDAWKNPDKLYTAVFDECHKTNTIEMINDELLQAISIARNDENRFISLDEDTSKLYKNSEKDESGNIKIPDNFGFIFISSKPEIFKNNPDFCNRVDLIEITETKRPDTIKKLDYLRKITKSEKKGLLDLLDAKQNQ